MPDPWMLGETSGIAKAAALRPEIAGGMISDLKTISVVGNEIGEYPIEIVEQMIERSGAKVVKTESPGSNELEVGEYERHGAMEIVDLLCEPPGEEWNFELVVLAGIAYHIESRMIAELKAYGGDIRVMTLNWRHQQRADFSFPNISEPGEWEKSLKRILENVK